jgi:hypothetical protein
MVVLMFATDYTRWEFGGINFYKKSLEAFNGK